MKNSLPDLAGVADQGGVVVDRFRASEIELPAYNPIPLPAKPVQGRATEVPVVN